MLVYHTSPSEIIKIERRGSFDDMLFFAASPYVMAACETITYSLDIDEGQVLDVQRVWFDHVASEVQDIVDEVVDRFECSVETAESYLDGSDHPDLDDGDGAMFIQAQQGHMARNLGYLAAEATDEQGTVYIVPMLGREKDLKLILDIA